MEIERKFLIKTLPSDLESYPSSHIEQAYLNEQPVLRIRKKDDTYILTYKSKGMLAREESEFSLTQEAYEHLRTKADGKIHHTRLSSMYLKAIWRLLSWLK